MVPINFHIGEGWRVKPISLQMYRAPSHYHADLLADVSDAPLELPSATDCPCFTRLYHAPNNLLGGLKMKNSAAKSLADTRTLPECHWEGGASRTPFLIAPLRLLNILGLPRDVSSSGCFLLKGTLSFFSSS
jgi:hypothetical protein